MRAPALVWELHLPLVHCYENLVANVIPYSTDPSMTADTRHERTHEPSWTSYQVPQITAFEA